MALKKSETLDVLKAKLPGIIKTSQTITRNWEYKYYLSKPEPDKASKEISRILLNMWGSASTAKDFIKVLSLATGTQFTFYNKKDLENLEFVIGVVVVPLENPNSHSYELNVPHIMIHPTDDVFNSADGHLGNHMTTQPDSVRAATDKEIEEIIKSLFKTNPELLVALAANKEFDLP